MRFSPYVTNQTGQRIHVVIEEMKFGDALKTETDPIWQTSWTSDYILSDDFEKYAVKLEGELIALGAYEILENSLVVHIVYMEAHPDSNPNFVGSAKKYSGIGQLLIAFGIKLSIDNGFNGDVVLEAKTPELEKHYMKDFGAVKLPVFSSSAPRFLIADAAAKRIFFQYLVD